MKVYYDSSREVVELIDTATAASPIITEFTSTPASLPSGGGAVTLHATIQNALSLTLDGAQVAGTDTFALTVPLVATRSFTLGATGAVGTTPASASLTVDVAAAPPLSPTITNFVAVPASLPAAGGAVTLNATVANAVSLALDGAPVVLPATVSLTASHNFSLVATGVAGTTPASASLVVNVAIAPPPPPPPDDGTDKRIIVEDSYSGIARDSYHHALGLPWRGPFTGAQLGASAPFKFVAPGNWVSIPLSSAPEVLVVRTSAAVNLRSREDTTSNKPPHIDVVYKDGTTGTLACLADSEINPSTAAPLGNALRLQLSVGPAVLRFAVAAKPVASATLLLFCYWQANTATLSAYEFLAPTSPATGPVYGLRAAGKLNGPEILHATDFSAANWWLPWWKMVSAAPTAAQAAKQITDHDWDTGEKFSSLAYLTGHSSNPTASWDTAGGFPGSPAFEFGLNGMTEREEVYFSYRLRLGNGFRGGATQAGKLPGIASDTSAAGNGGAQSNGRNGWSFRGHFLAPMSPQSPYNSNNGRMPIGYYSYNPDQITENQITGLSYPWTGRGEVGLIEIGKDHWIDQYIKVNTPGQRDGIARGWINGQLAYERTDHYMRALPPYQVAGNLGINKVWMTFLHGGQPLPLPTKMLRTYWSDWIISTEFVGPPK